MDNILNKFRKVSSFQFLNIIKKNGLELKELSNNNWIQLKSWKGNFEGFNEPIFLYEKVNGQIKIAAVGLFKTIN